MFTNVGGEVEMTCQIKNGKEYPIMWMRLPGKESPSGSDQKSYPITSGKSLLFKDPRLTLESDDKLGTYTLKISNVKITDEAVYQCQVCAYSSKDWS